MIIRILLIIKLNFLYLLTLGAICAAPAVVFASHKLLDNKISTCYPATKFISMIDQKPIKPTYLDLIPLKNMNAHSTVTNSKLVYKKYVTVDGRYEDCEHRAFYIQASQNSGARIMISPEIIFT